MIDEAIKYTIGIWGADKELQSSNYWELQNTVDTTERQALDGKLHDSMIFFCTDNSTVENALFHGRSKESPTLHALVVRLKILEPKYGFQLLVIHVAGERMKAQGTYEIGRASCRERV